MGKPASSTVLRFDARFAGPYPGWTNGGYLAGVLATHLAPDGDPSVEVRIGRPVPLETDLRASIADSEVVLVGDGGPLATARPIAQDPPAGAPVPVSTAAASEPVLDPRKHPAPGCFVCGPGRPGGLDLQPGSVPGRDLVAALWEPSPDLADDHGVVPLPIVWAALDCPAWYGAARGRPALLGTMRARRFRPLRAGAPVVVTGWGTGRDGRKEHAGAAIHTRDGEPVAVASSIWIYEEGT